MENNTLESKKLEILKEQLEVHRKQDKRAGILLHLAMILTGLLYFMFEKHLFLGDAVTWGAYFQEWHSALDFMLMFGIVVMSAVFLAWVKHHAYLHFGLYGSIGLIVFTVIGFALFAEFFSSSASQDTKSRVLLANDPAYQATIAPVTPITPGISSNAAVIAKAEQSYARCQANLGKPGYKHCDGDKALMDSLKASEAESLKASKEIAVQSSIATEKLRNERQDKLKADSYNAVIVSIARFLGGVTGTPYTDNIKTAIVLTMLIVAVAFEILHHFLSHAKERAQNAVYGLELELAKQGGATTLPEKPESVIPQNDGDDFQGTRVGFSAPIGSVNAATVHYSPSLPSQPLFKYQQRQEPEGKRHGLGFIGFVDPSQPQKPSGGDAAHATGKPLQATVGNPPPLQGTVYTGDCRGADESYKAAMDVPTGSKIACPNCGSVVVKRNQQHTFCSNSRKPRADGGNCSDEWHNQRDPKRMEALKAKSRRKRA